MNIGLHEAVLAAGFASTFMVYKTIIIGLTSVLRDSSHIVRIHAQAGQFISACLSIRISCLVMAGIMLILWALHILVPIPLILIAWFYFVCANGGLFLALYKGWQWRRELNNYRR